MWSAILESCHLEINKSQKFSKVICVTSSFSTEALQFQMPCQGNCHFHYLWECLSESADSVLDKIGRHVFFYRKVPLFISKAPQFRSHKTPRHNKSFSKAVYLSFYCQSRPQQQLLLWLWTEEQKCKLPVLVTFAFPIKWRLLLIALNALSFRERKLQLIWIAVFEPENYVFQPRSSWVSVSGDLV